MTITDAETAIRLNGVTLHADPSGALYWPERATLMIADLHLEKGSSFGRHGRLLPPYDTRATLDRLAKVARRLQPKRIVALGDSFHDAEAADRLDEKDRQRLRLMTRRYEWIWIAGNHDPEPPADWGGQRMDEIILGPLVLRHEAVNGQCVPGEVSGHFHPKAAVRIRGKRVSARCFVGDERRLVLPAFGAFAGGLSVLDPAIASLFVAGFEVHMLGRGRIHRFPGHALSA